MQRKRLSDILRDGDRQSLARFWSETEAAEEFGPLPAGEYIARILSGELAASKTKGTPAYKLTFRILEGDFEGRHVWHDLWLTEAAISQTKRDLAKLGVTCLEQLDRPLPPGIRCRVKVALRRDDDGNEHNRVKHFEVLGIDPPEDDAFAPARLPEPSPAPFDAACVVGGVA